MDLETNAMVNVFDMLISRLSNVEATLAWLSRTAALAAPAGTKIPGAFFGVPFDIYKYYNACDDPLRLQVWLNPRNYHTFHDALKRTPPAGVVFMSVIYEPSGIMFCLERTSLPVAIEHVMDFLKAKQVDPAELESISLHHVELKEMFELFYEANRPDPWDVKQTRLRSIVDAICSDKARGELIRCHWRDTYCGARELNVSEEAYECVFRAFEPHLGEY